MEKTAVDVTVTGRVQGVAFRWHCEEEARRLGVRGWVRNDYADGSVRGHFEGEPDAVDDLVAWCRSGPPSARVESVDASPGEVTGASGFETTG